jgi:hypothetical protein
VSKEEEERKAKDKCTHVEEASTDVNHWKPKGSRIAASNNKHVRTFNIL